jgi:asparagine synthase (glutamine-hydrolysing)
MCGISGVVSQKPLRQEQVERVAQMNAALLHRGPDGEGAYHNPHLTLAMRRLSIIDLESGWQPIYNEDKSLVIIANGEIYNYIELQQELQTRGHQFRTRSDIESILHLYEDYGFDCVHHLRGMFAFALWDTKKKVLFLARDRMGEKPLYLWEQEGILYFASETKALLAGLKQRPKLDPEAVDLFFHWNYVPEPGTILQGVRKLPAGHFLIIDVEPWRVLQNKYWDMVDAPPLEGDPINDIRAELERISEIIIRSDVPVGIALSGGIDSGALAALTADKYPGKMHAFTIGYEGRPGSDEREQACELAKHLGMPFHELEIKTDEMVRFFPDLIRHTDDPIADIAGHGYYLVNRLARDHGVPVMIQGQGGDELFWGYPWLNRTTLKNIKYRKPNLFRKCVRLIDKDKSKINEHQLAFMDDHSIFKIAALWKAKGLYTDEFVSKLNDITPYRPMMVHASIEIIPILMTKLICQTYLLENGIAQGDRLSMASSVELRLPLVDYRLVEVIIGHRKSSPDLFLGSKFWLRKALQGLLPNEVMNRPKSGFTPPTKEWFYQLLVEYGNKLPNGYLENERILAPKSAMQLSRGKAINEKEGMPIYYKALCLEMWCRTVLESDTSI